LSKCSTENEVKRSDTSEISLPKLDRLYATVRIWNYHPATSSSGIQSCSFM